MKAGGTVIYSVVYNTTLQQIAVRADKSEGDEIKSASAAFSMLELEAARLRARRLIVEQQLWHSIPWPVPQRVINAVLALVE